jgi:hypothetical protein
VVTGTAVDRQLLDDIARRGHPTFEGAVEPDLAIATDDDLRCLEDEPSTPRSDPFFEKASGMASRSRPRTESEAVSRSRARRRR